MHLRNVVLALGATATLAFCQSTLDATYQIGYAANLANAFAIDSYIDIINTGGNGGVSAFGPQFGTPNSGNICVNIYALDADEEMISCCSCLITPNQVVQLKVAGQILTSGTLTGVPVPAMTLKLVGSTAGGSPSSCDGSAATVGTPGNNNIPVGGYVAFSTTVHCASPNNCQGTKNYALTETAFLPAKLSVDGSELSSLTSRCAFILGNGGGHYGNCGWASATGSPCSPGALGASKK